MSLICEIVERHQQQNAGQTDLIWLQEHVMTCPTCQQIMAITDAYINDSLAELDPARDGTEDDE